MKEIKIWWLYTKNSFLQTLASRGGALLLFMGKILRVGLFLVFLGFLFQGAKTLAGYSREQIIFFYLSFNLIDTLAQFFFREVYRFRQLVVSGNFDFVLLKPASSLLRVLLGGADVLDFIMLVALLILTGGFAYQNFSLNFSQIFLYFLLIINGLVIAAAFHIAVLGIGIITTSIDHLVMIYRDLTSMLRIPVDLYVDPVRFLLTFVLPLGLMITIPSKALLGLLDLNWILISLFFGAASLFLSLKFWRFSLQKYSSASS